MISLDDEELAVITELAQPLPPDRRSAFLAVVIEDASQHMEIGPGMIARIARGLQGQYMRHPSAVEERGPPPQHGRLGHRVQR